VKVKVLSHHKWGMLLTELIIESDSGKKYGNDELRRGKKILQRAEHRIKLFDAEVKIEKNILRVLMKSRFGPLQCIAHAHEDENQFAFYSRFPSYVEKERRPEMLELLSRINYRLMIGNFEMDPSDGELNFKTSLDLAGVNYDGKLLDNCMSQNIETMQRWMTAIYSVSNGELDSVDAMQTMLSVDGAAAA